MISIELVQYYEYYYENRYIKSFSHGILSSILVFLRSIIFKIEVVNLFKKKKSY